MAGARMRMVEDPHNRDGSCAATAAQSWRLQLFCDRRAPTWWGPPCRQPAARRLCTARASTNGLTRPPTAAAALPVSLTRRDRASSAAGVRHDGAIWLQVRLVDSLLARLPPTGQESATAIRRRNWRSKSLLEGRYRKYRRRGSSHRPSIRLRTGLRSQHSVR